MCVDEVWITVRCYVSRCLFVRFQSVTRMLSCGEVEKKRFFTKTILQKSPQRKNSSRPWPLNRLTPTQSTQREKQKRHPLIAYDDDEGGGTKGPEARSSREPAKPVSSGRWGSTSLGDEGLLPACPMLGDRIPRVRVLTPSRREYASSVCSSSRTVPSRTRTCSSGMPQSSTWS